MCSPGAKETNEDVEFVPEDPENFEENYEDFEKLAPAEATVFRGLAATANYLGADRVDLQHAAKELCRLMSAPTVGARKKLKHLARYLVGVPELSVCYPWQYPPELLVAYVDSDWAGCRRTRKSTSGGIICHGAHVVKSWSTTQATIALSSGEAELYANIEGAARLMGAQSLAADLGWSVGLEMHTDSSAGKSIASRQGIGKVRHLDTKFLWLQQAVFTKRLIVKKIKGTENPGDVLTKYLSANEMQRVLEAYGLILRRSASCS